MDTKRLEETAAALVAKHRGILAADESTGTIAKRFSGIGVENTEENRRAYRALLFSTRGAEEFVSGVILFDETIRQKSDDGTPLPELLSQRGILPGIKVDEGAKSLAGSPKEKVTEGLDGLRERLREYGALGARFAKWRAVIEIGDGMPSRQSIRANAEALARYAALCQEAGIVPIVEPEVLMDGAHTLERCEQVTGDVLHEVFAALREHGVWLEGSLLKPNMVIAGGGAGTPSKPADVATATLRCFRRVVPAAVPGIVFLSGGQTEVQATENLNAMNAAKVALPWKLSFSYGRALQDSALKAWRGDAGRARDGQAAFLHRARMNAAACAGTWKRESEGR